MIEKQSRWRSRGFTIVEAALSIVVLSLLLGMALVPLNKRQEARQAEETQVMLEEIRKAIVGYALRNRTARSVAAAGPAGNSAQITRSLIPAGRPYLPCPDHDGDGREDRFPAPVSQTLAEFTFSETQLTPPLTLVVPQQVLQTIFLYRGSATSREMQLGGNSRGGSQQYGICHSDKGFVPWTTLGTPPADPYGNRFTYRVDPMFANSALGIGQETRADVFDPRLPLLSTVVAGRTIRHYARRATVYLAHSGSSQRFADDQPTILCVEPTSQAERTALANGCDAADTAANNVASAPLTIFDSNALANAARLYETGDVISGPAFVVVSHGKHAPGAVLHNNGDNTAITERTNATDRFVCRISGPGSYPSGYIVGELERENVSSVFNCPEHVVSGAPNATRQARNHAFIAMRSHESAASIFDDQLVFMSDTALIGQLTALGLIETGAVFIPPASP